MASRRDRSPDSRSPDSRDARSTGSRRSRPGGRRRGGGGGDRSSGAPRPAPEPGLRRRRLAQAGLALVGAVGGLGLLGLVWPEYDPALATDQEITPATLAEKPRRPITVLVIGSDADSLGAPQNGAAPRGPANADALLLVRVNPKGPLQVLQLPVELAVNLPGSRSPVALGSLYRVGGAGLTSDVVRELVGLEASRPDRYVVLPRGALRQLVDGLSGLEVNPPGTLRYRDRSLNYRIDLQGGLQTLSGPQVEQLVRYRDRWLGEQSRRRNHEIVITGIRERLSRPDVLQQLPALLSGLQGKVETNLSGRETLSLLAAGLDNDRPILWASLPLDPQKPGHGRLRQLRAAAPQPLWPVPAASGSAAARP